ncbi:MAG: hypothetical protein MMC33_003733 [Icmadophila ericetorum]|nr:hypothetical protein [Icmadophila ericetorum]
MVKFHTTTHTYAYPLPAVSLAYFLRYPNPYSTHVLSTDVISRTFDPQTQRLHSVRLHLKRSKFPPAVLKLLPKGMLGGSAGGEGKSFILEKSIVDVREGWMETESRNLEWTGVLSVVERGRFEIGPPLEELESATVPVDGGDMPFANKSTVSTTTVTFHSRFGQPRSLFSKSSSTATSSTSVSTQTEQAAPKQSLFSSWSTSSVQRTIETLGVRRTRDALVKSALGMNVVLERLRSGGLVGVLEGMRRDREDFGLVGPGGPVGGGGGNDGGGGAMWKRVWDESGED